MIKPVWSTEMHGPQVELYKAIEVGTLEDMQRALDAGACPNTTQNGQPSPGAALLRLVLDDGYSVEKAQLLIDSNCKFTVDHKRICEGPQTLIWAVMAGADRGGFYDEAAVNLACFLYKQGAPVNPEDMEYDPYAEFMRLVDEKILEEHTSQVACEARARRL